MSISKKRQFQKCCLKITVLLFVSNKVLLDYHQGFKSYCVITMHNFEEKEEEKK